jgi:2-amino-4-hydroxy-6-hydroxymethyldihydropteridine diphosphokinase
MTGERVFIGLGSNLGDRRGNLERALDALDRIPGVRLVRASRFHWTAPWGVRDQPWFLNAAAELACALEPRDLLAALLRVEAESGRVRTVRNGPRTLDLDLLLYGDRVVEEEGLSIPHPRLRDRRFVLAPLAEIGADARHPTAGASVGELLASLPPGPGGPLEEAPSACVRGTRWDGTGSRTADARGSGSRAEGRP